MPNATALLALADRVALLRREGTALSGELASLELELRALAAPEAAGAAECCVAAPGEPQFVLLGRDPQAPMLVEAWAFQREQADPSSTKPPQAREIAERMREWKGNHPQMGLAASALTGSGEAPWSYEPILAGYQCNGYRIKAGDEVVARVQTYGPERDEEVAELIIHCVNARLR